LIWDKWGIDVTKYSTITSLAFANFRQNYLEKGIIPIIKGKTYKFIKESYTGGSTEMYKPNPDGPVYCYDVNGLYPTQMANWGMPTGPIRQFEGDITILDQDKYYWIGDAEVNTKRNMYQPYLQIHCDTGKGFRTIAPNGNFSMKINSVEYANALKDYNITVKNGFLFDKTNIFREYINDMYNLRLQYPKDHPMNAIAKLMANSLYGRFALNPILENHKFCSWEEFKTLSETCNIIEEMDLGEDSMFTSYTSKNESLESSIKTSISIASAVTAYARVHMSFFKNNPDFELYYTDTDSAYINKPLPDHMVGSGLGQMKLEYIFTDCVFLGAKIYAGITTNGKYICKIKGFKDAKSISLEDMKSLLRKDATLSLKHSKWFRNLAESNILIKEQVYELSKNEAKREFVYNDSNEAIDTKAFNVTYSRITKTPSFF